MVLDHVLPKEVLNIPRHNHDKGIPQGAKGLYKIFFIVYQKEFLQWANLIFKNPNNLNKDNSYGGADFSHA